MLLEADKPLSQSMLWQIQRAYFETAGMRAWQDDVVPHTISCNPFMARAYANLIKAYLQDMAAHIDPAEPVHVIELGAGSGRLTFHLMHQLAALGDGKHNLKFVLTDFTADVVDFWRSHPQLQPLAEQGLLDFALFDATHPAPFKTLIGRQTIDPKQTKNPIILLANYFFDSIPQDSFLIEDGELQHIVLSLHSTQEEPDLADPTLWERLSLLYDPLPLTGPPYENNLYNEILADYEQLPDTALTFPNVGLDCLCFWMAGQNGLLLTADRGYSHATSLIGQDDLQPNLHGSFSMMVNYHAISEFVERIGGWAFVPPHYQDNVQTLSYVWGTGDDRFDRLSMAFEQTIVQNGPDDFFGLRYHLLAQIPQMSVDQILSLLRWSAGDAEMVRKALPILAEQIEEEPAWATDIIDMLKQAKVQYLAIRPDDDLIELINRF